jgi:hypothetical protein
MSEYRALEARFSDPEQRARLITQEFENRISRFTEKRRDGNLTWNDIYSFELLLTDIRPVLSLRGKIMALRSDYRAVAGQAEYDEYMASKPTQLQNPPDPAEPPDATTDDLVKLMREDLKDLLGRLYLQYSILPVREAQLKRLTIWAAVLCGVFLVILLAFVISMYMGSDDGNASTNDNRNTSANDNKSALTNRERPRLPSLSLFVVLCAGAMGGFVSALQRTQTSTHEGDSIYNLSMLYHGSYAVFVAPLTGAIFAILLYLMFTGRVLEGRFFPQMYTPPPTFATPTPTPTPTPTTNANSNTNAGSNAATAAASFANPTQTPAAPTPSPAGVRRPAAAATTSTTPAPQPTVSPTDNTNNPAANSVRTDAAASNTNANTSPASTPTPQQKPTQSLGIKIFLKDSGPAGGEDYALLVIWSFIAGFAERFVPDALNRLVAGKQTDTKAKS